MPPQTPGDQTSKNWSKVVGEQPNQNPNEPQPTVAGGFSFANVDKPPGDSRDILVKETAKDMEANRELRDKYANRAYELACGCICSWVVMLGSYGVVKAATGVEMWSDHVIMAATTGVTVSVLAAFLGVIRGLFPNDSKAK